MILGGFQKIFSGLQAEPTNRPLVRDYDPDTPLPICLVAGQTTSISYYFEQWKFELGRAHTTLISCLQVNESLMNHFWKLITLSG